MVIFLPEWFPYLSLECVACFCLELHDLAVDEALCLGFLELHVVVPDIGLQEKEHTSRVAQLIVLNKCRPLVVESDTCVANPYFASPYVCIRHCAAF